jgi:hypothetical protein
LLPHRVSLEIVREHSLQRELLSCTRTLRRRRRDGLYANPRVYEGTAVDGGEGAGVQSGLGQACRSVRQPLHLSDDHNRTSSDTDDVDVLRPDPERLANTEGEGTVERIPTSLHNSCKVHVEGYLEL